MKPYYTGIVTILLPNGNTQKIPIVTGPKIK